MKEIVYLLNNILVTENTQNSSNVKQEKCLNEIRQG